MGLRVWGLEVPPESWSTYPQFPGHMEHCAKGAGGPRTQVIEDLALLLSLQGLSAGDVQYPWVHRTKRLSGSSLWWGRAFLEAGAWYCHEVLLWGSGDHWFPKTRVVAITLIPRIVNLRHIRNGQSFLGVLLVWGDLVHHFCLSFRDTFARYFGMPSVGNGSVVLA